VFLNLCICSNSLRTDLMTTIWLFPMGNPTYGSLWLMGTGWYCSIIMFLKFFHICREEILTHCMFRILLEASKIAKDLFVIKLCICKG
jgi:hypothetical protein